MTSRATDLQIIAEYRAVSTELLECLHASAEMIAKIGDVLPLGEARQAFDIGIEDISTQLAGIRERLKSIHAAQVENVRITMMESGT